MPANELKPRIALISLNQKPWFDDVYTSLLNQLSSKATIQRSKKANSALRLLTEEPHPSAVLITDEALTEDNNAQVWEAVLQYVRQGGTAVIMGLFSSFVRHDNVAPFFARAGLPWGTGSYHRTTLFLNREAAGPEVTATLLPQYSQKALSLSHVAGSDAWYRSTESSVIESHVFPLTSANNENETPVALTRIGDGRLGYVGDVNAEAGSDAVILAMCGLHK
ncbi:hypothetical protein F5Y03DRAFT_19141 [Xylaria venustula]|nr:hypothetical protein F5Y03DRAFT_19141 [Xylaria venustula]